MRKIEHITINNFKSIQEASFEASDVNVFIGEPNAGKSNILEALAFSSINHYKNTDLNDLLRFRYPINLFNINSEKKEFKLSINCKENRYEFIFRQNESKTELEIDNNSKQIIHKNIFRNDGKNYRLAYTFDSEIPVSKLYKFNLKNSEFIASDSEYLLFPRGENLPSIIVKNEELKDYFGKLIGGEHKKLGYRQESEELEEINDMSDIIIKSLPWSSFSDGMKNYMYNLAAVESNKDSIILLEEPESHYFPFYTKIFAERIHHNLNNQYFIATHNPYFLNTLLDKIPENKLKIYLVYSDINDSKLLNLPHKYLIDYDFDIFLNIDKIREELESK